MPYNELLSCNAMSCSMSILPGKSIYSSQYNMSGNDFAAPDGLKEQMHKSISYFFHLSCRLQ